MQGRLSSRSVAPCAALDQGSGTGLTEPSQRSLRRLLPLPLVCRGGNGLRGHLAGGLVISADHQLFPLSAFWLKAGLPILTLMWAVAT